MTKAEWTLWYHLRTRGFKAQCVLFGYIPDFVNKHRKMCVEVDGSSHDNPIQQKRDRIKDSILNNHGYCVIRFANNEIFRDIKAVMRRLGYKI